MYDDASILERLDMLEEKMEVVLIAVSVLTEHRELQLKIDSNTKQGHGPTVITPEGVANGEKGV